MGDTASVLNNQILLGAETAFINSDKKSSEQYRPRFVSNNKEANKKVRSFLDEELQRCTSFDFSVAFINKGGIASLLQRLKELELKDIHGRIMTTDYLAFSDPDALEQLNAFKNIEVRMYQTLDDTNSVGFHTKGYLFTYKDGFQKALIGSSNLTSAALTKNKEWNLQFTSTNNGELIRSIRDEYEQLWSVSVPLQDVIDVYRQMYEEKKRALKSQKVITYEQVVLEPNEMQVAFVSNLKKLVAQGAKRALLISATGTGKTYASAFAMRSLSPKRLLFVAHREQILKQSVKSYSRVLGNTKTYGILSGNAHDVQADCLFATMQTISKSSVLETFDPEEFDCIVIDEVHRAGSQSYQKILDYFKPRFALGMTASPDRPDGFDIYKLFDNNIAYEIRLEKALENNLLCPFHYFGISDLSIDGEIVDENSDFRYLVSDQRVDHIIEQISYYGYSGSRVKGLVFCSRKSEAQELSRLFNERGYSTVALSGSNSQEERESAVKRLSVNEGESGYQDKLDYIFTVDIFNEGVDIPEINQVVMLRPTMSPIIFIQQLGRGLRRIPEKDYVVVLDFIGNYANNYMIPIALSGDRSYNKDTLRKYVMEGDRVIPGESSVHFDEVSRRKIFNSIDRVNVGLNLVREKYRSLKHKLGRIPRMVDFYEWGEIDPLLIIEKKKSYYRFLEAEEPSCKGMLSETEHLALEFASRYFGNGMRPHELLVLKAMLERIRITDSEMRESLREYNIVGLTENDKDSVFGVLSKKFVNTPSDKTSFESFSFVALDVTGNIVRHADLTKMIENKAFKEALSDIVEFGLRRYRDKYIKNDDGFTLYEKYTRKDVCRLLDWEQDNSSTVYGYRVKYNTCPIFVTYEKTDDISMSTQYADHFASPYIFNWKTRSNLTLESPEVVKIREAEETGLDIRLFIKKSNNEGSDFYYFGKVHPVSFKQNVQKADNGKSLPIVDVQFELEHPVRDDMYEYFEGSYSGYLSEVV